MTTPDLQKLDELEEVIAYQFRDRGLLAQAMTHRSWAHEQISPRSQLDARHLHNEALEFLGDSILGLAVADYLFRAYPGASEGELSRMKHRLVSAPTLAKASTKLGLGDFVRFGHCVALISKVGLNKGIVGTSRHSFQTGSKTL